MVNINEFFKNHEISIVKSDIKNLIVITIWGDVNDADYESQETSFSTESEEDMDAFAAIVETMRTPGWKQYFVRDDENQYSIDDLDPEKRAIFKKAHDELEMPNDDYFGRICHTITDIDVQYYDGDGNIHLLNFPIE